MRTLRIHSGSPYRRLIGVGGVGTGVFFKLSGNHTLGRNESREGALLDVRDYCKLHIVIHYIAKLLGAGKKGSGFEILALAKVGDDTPGRVVRKEMEEVGVDTGFVEVVTGKPTLFSVCFQYPDGTGGNITTNNSAAAELTNADVDRMQEQCAIDPARTIALIVPEAPLSVRHHFLEIASRAGCFRAASFVSGEIASAKASGMFKLLDLVAVNESEASELLGREFSANQLDSFAESCLLFMDDHCPSLRLVVSLGKRGVLGFANQQWMHCPAPEVPVVSTAGAGDALLAGVVSGLTAGLPFLNFSRHASEGPSRLLGSALELGMMLASYTVTSPHTIHPQACLDSLLAFMSKLGCQVDPHLEGMFAETA